MLATPSTVSAWQVISEVWGQYEGGHLIKTNVFEPDNETVKLGQHDHVSVECIHEFYTVYGNNKQVIDLHHFTELTDESYICYLNRNWNSYSSNIYTIYGSRVTND